MKPEDLLQSQLSDELRIENAESLVVASRTMVSGLGGSRLAAGILKDVQSDVHVSLHSGFDAPAYVQFAGGVMVASSTSGETAETISAYEHCGELGLARSVLTWGGKLLARAKEDRVPYVIMPPSPLPPRESLVHSLSGLCLLLGQHGALKAARASLEKVSVEQVTVAVDSVLQHAIGRSLLLYAPDVLEGVMRYLKVNLNETARVPAYIGLLPETLHGEIAVYDGGSDGPDLRSSVCIMQFKTEDTDPRIALRMQALAETLSQKGLRIETVVLPGAGWDSVFFGAVFSLVLADRLREHGGILRGGENAIAAFKRTMQQYT